MNHALSGYFSLNGYDWMQVGSSISVFDMDNLQPDYNAWTGNRQGLFVQGNNPADFDFYIYRDAYTPILAECPANQYGTIPSGRPVGGVRFLDDIHDGDWALYAGVEFGNDEYKRKPDSLTITASCGSSGGVVEVWLDSLDTGTKIAECAITNTGSWDFSNTFTSGILRPASGNHDVYLRFKGSGSDRLFILQWLVFSDNASPSTSVGQSAAEQLPEGFRLVQNYPNPFNGTTAISYQLPALSGVEGSAVSFVKLSVLDILGREVATLVNGQRAAGNHTETWNASGMPSGVYIYRIEARPVDGISARSFVDSGRMIVLK